MKQTQGIILLLVLGVLLAATAHATTTSTTTALTLSVTHCPTSVLYKGQDVTVYALANKPSTIKLYIDSHLVKTCTNSIVCGYVKQYSVGTHTYYAVANRTTTVRAPLYGTKSFTIKDWY